MMELDDWVAAAEAAADVAGAVIRPYFRMPGRAFDATLKADHSPVTVADRSAEQAMRAVLTQRFPEHGTLCEEYGLDRLEARLRWVLDPIDGTRAFITGRPTFGTLIALLENSVPVLGVIDQPITGERWVGVIGQPTRFRGPFGGSAGCRLGPALAQAELSCTSPEMLARQICRIGSGWLPVSGGYPGVGTAMLMACSHWDRSISSRKAI
jgi:fructose-1,6-bisphosphatase/inositol monophosphatase family enzyme